MQSRANYLQELIARVIAARARLRKLEGNLPEPGRGEERD